VATALDRTFQLLAQSGHPAIDGLLLAALNSPYAEIQQGALRTLLTRRSAAGDRWILAEWRRFDQSWQSFVLEHAGSMTSALREAIVGADLELCRNACDLAQRQRDYDLIPALVIAVESPDAAQSQLCGETLLRLTAELRQATSPRQGTANEPSTQDLEPVRRNVLASLERYMKRFQRHKPTQPLEAYLMLAKIRDEALQNLLQDSHDPAFVAIVYLLAHSEQPGVMRLLLDNLEDPQAQSAPLNAIGHRNDQLFLRRLLDRLGDTPTEVVKGNLRRIETFVWLREDLDWLAKLEETYQDRLVQMLVHTGIKKSDLFQVLEYILQTGQPLGRRAAAKILAEFHGTEASALTMRALDDDDPQVQAAAVSQLRQRNLSNTLSLLLDRLESPHLVVRQAARANLAEYSFKRYLASFDVLNEAARRSTGKLVKRIDPQTTPLLREQFLADSRTKRLRAVAMAIVLELCDEFEAEAIELLGDPDHVIRAEAARLLGSCHSPTSQAALKRALADESVMVREAAAASNSRREVAPKSSAALPRVAGVEITEAQHV
jgi:HEAT repeat protein